MRRGSRPPCQSATRKVSMPRTANSSPLGRRPISVLRKGAPHDVARADELAAGELLLEIEADIRERGPERIGEVLEFATAAEDVARSVVNSTSSARTSSATPRSPRTIMSSKQPRPSRRAASRRDPLPRVRFHDLRHSAATLMSQPRRASQDRLGDPWAQPDLDHCGHLHARDTGMQREAAAALDAALGG